MQMSASKLSSFWRDLVGPFLSEAETHNHFLGLNPKT